MTCPECGGQQAIAMVSGWDLPHGRKVVFGQALFRCPVCHGTGTVADKEEGGKE